MLTLQSELETGNLILVCNGSLLLPYGAAAYILTTKRTMDTDYLHGTTRTTGPPAAQDSYRSELFGILAGILHINKIVKEWNLRHLKLQVLVACDIIEALKVSFDHKIHPIICSRYDHFNIIHSIRASALFNVHYTYQHVEGHQDDIAGPHVFDELSLLNIRMDTMRKQTRRELSNARAPTNWSALLPAQTWTASLNQERLCKHLQESILEFISARRMKLYLHTQNIIPSDQFDSVDWDMVNEAQKALAPGRRRWMVKHMSEVCGVNIWRQRWQDREDDKCPRCSHYMVQFTSTKTLLVT